MRKKKIWLSYSLAAFLCAFFSALKSTEKTLLASVTLPEGGAVSGEEGIEMFALVLAFIVGVAVITLIALLLPEVLRLRRRK